MVLVFNYYSDRLKETTNAVFTLAGGPRGIESKAALHRATQRQIQDLIRKAASHVSAMFWNVAQGRELKHGFR